MSKVFVIPDVHLKPWIFDKAEELIARMKYDAIVCLGDLMDDWNQQMNLGLYTETINAVDDFVRRHPNFFLCYGNHDLSYVWRAYETGYSDYARQTVLDGLFKLAKNLPAENIAFVHRIDNVLFSHAGLSEVFVSHFLSDFDGDIDDFLMEINGFGKEEMWNDVSPIWVRPQDGHIEMYSNGFLQVVGHTPMRKTDFFRNILTVDNFSTYSDGTPIGDQRFIWVDTVAKEWGFADGDGNPEKLPDPRLDVRNYKVGDYVKFKVRWHDTQKEEILKGTIQAIDRYSGGYAEIDILSGDIIYKHFSLEDVISFGEL